MPPYRVVVIDTATGQQVDLGSKATDFVTNQWGSEISSRLSQDKQQGKISNIGAYVPNGGTWEQNMTQLGQQLNPQQRQPVAYWNPNTNVVYAGGMPTQMPQVVSIGYGYSQGYGTAPLVYDMTQGQYVGGSMNQFGPTGNATVPMTTETTITPAASNNTNSNNQAKKLSEDQQKRLGIRYNGNVATNVYPENTSSKLTPSQQRAIDQSELNVITPEEQDNINFIQNTQLNDGTITSTTTPTTTPVTSTTANEDIVGNATGEIQWSRLPQALLLRSLGLPEQYPQAWADRGYTDFDHKVVVLRNYGLETYKDIYGQDPTQDVIDAVRNGRRYDYFGGLVQL